MTETPRTSVTERVQQFLQWFSALEPDEQRDVVKSLGAMGLEQRREGFERLGLPADLVSRIPAPEPSAMSEGEVEWVDWKAPGS